MKTKKKNTIWHRDGGPQSDFARYAYGYSDKKPGWNFWLIIGGMVIFILYQIISIG